MKTRSLWVYETGASALAVEATDKDTIIVKVGFLTASGRMEHEIEIKDDAIYKLTGSLMRWWLRIPK